MESDYTAADVVLVGTGVGTVGAVTLAASQFLGKKAAGAATNLTATEARAILNVADGANAYVHPNHSGDVTSAADGAQTIGAKKVTVAMLADGTAGQLVTWDAAGVAATVAAGTATHVLTSNGAGDAPTFQAATVSDNTITAAKLNTAVLTGLTAETAIADADLLLIDDGAGGTLRKMTRGNLITQPCFSAYNSTLTTINNTTVTKILFATEEYDIGGYFADSAYTPPAGKYILTVSVLFADALSDGTNVILYLYKDGAEFKRAAHTYSAKAGILMVHGSFQVVANGSEVFDIRIYHDYGSSRNTYNDSKYTWFSGARVSP
jgi:hypothetical protein